MICSSSRGSTQANSAPVPSAQACWWTRWVAHASCSVYGWVSGHENRCVSTSEKARNFAGMSASRHGRSATMSSRRTGFTSADPRERENPASRGVSVKLISLLIDVFEPQWRLSRDQTSRGWRSRPQPTDKLAGARSSLREGRDVRDQCRIKEFAMGGISVGGILVIVGIVVMIVGSFWLGLIIALIGLVAFGGFARGRWY